MRLSDFFTAVFLGLAGLHAAAIVGDDYEHSRYEYARIARPRYFTGRIVRPADWGILAMVAFLHGQLARMLNAQEARVDLQRVAQDMQRAARQYSQPAAPPPPPPRSGSSGPHPGPTPPPSDPPPAPPQQSGPVNFR